MLGQDAYRLHHHFGVVVMSRNWRTLVVDHRYPVVGDQNYLGAHHLVGRSLVGGKEAHRLQEGKVEGLGRVNVTL